MPSSVSDRLVEIFSRQTIKNQPKKDGTVYPSRVLSTEQNARLKKFKQTAPLRQLEILQKARNRLAQGWVAHEIATDKDGNAVPPDSPKACIWCMSGALQAAAYEYGSPKTAATKQRIDQAARTILHVNLGSRGFRKSDPVITLAALNDNVIESRTQALEFFDKAIEVQTNKCKEKGLL